MWSNPEDVPMHELLDELTEDDPRIEAMKQALRALYERYPEKLPDADGYGLHPREWRENAIGRCDKGDLALALYYADGTGIPQEELITLAMLFSR
jgi:hypothetical protein